MRVMILDGHLNPAVACVRALGREGHRVCVGAARPRSKATWSRFCQEKFVYPSTKADASGFVQCITKQVARQPGTFVLPVAEPTALTVSAYRDLIISAGGRVVMPPHEAMKRACNKWQSTALATSAGVHTPRTYLITLEREAGQLAAAIEYPVVLKPCASEEVQGDNRVMPTCRPLYARSPEEFLSAYAEVREHCSAMLVQEFIPGEGVLTSVLLSRGALRAEFSYKRIRSVHPTGFGAALRVSVHTDPRMRHAALAVLRALDPEWHGIATVEFRVRPDGTPVFLEVNPRNVHSLPLAVYAGVNFPCLLAEMAERGDARASNGYVEGVLCRWLYGDFRRLLYIWIGSAGNYPARVPGRLDALRDFLTPVRGTLHDNFTLDDPIPELAEWVNAALDCSAGKLGNGIHLASGADT